MTSILIGSPFVFFTTPTTLLFLALAKIRFDRVRGCAEKSGCVGCRQPDALKKLYFGNDVRNAGRIIFCDLLDTKVCQRFTYNLKPI
jgi:hypothetical protein